MIKPRFVSFTVWYCEEVCTKYPGTEPSNIKMQEVTFSNSQTETCRNLYNICEGSVREGGVWDRNTPGEVSNKQMPSSVWGSLFSPVWSWSCPLQHYNWSVSDQCDTVTAHTCNYQSLHHNSNISKPLQCQYTAVCWDNVYYDCHTAHYHITGCHCNLLKSSPVTEMWE